MEMSGLGDMLEKKGFLIGCILRKLGHWDMAIKKLNLFRKKFNFLKIIILKLNIYQQDLTTAML
jgi:hypothetical protein